MLNHLRVIEFTSGLEAYAGRLLAELGAQVIKVEPPAGDPARRMGPFAPGVTDAGLPWLAWNAGKRSVVLDVAASPNETLALIKTADIVLTGANRGGLAPYAALAAANPRLIEIVILPFDEDGPYAGRPFDDLTLMAMSGLMNSVGDPDRPPLNLPGDQAHALVGIQAATAALLAVAYRHRSGTGQQAKVFAFQAAALANYRDPLVYEWEQRIGVRPGNQLIRGRSGVRQIWPCKDGFVTWALVDNPGMVKGMISFMQAEGLGDELATVDWENTLVANADQADIDRWELMLAPFFAGHTKEELFKMSNDKGLGLSRIDDLADALASPQWSERGFWRTIDDQTRGLSLTLPGAMFSSSLTQTPRTGPAPRLGEGNAEFGVVA